MELMHCVQLKLASSLQEVSRGLWLTTGGSAAAQNGENEQWDQISVYFCMWKGTKSAIEVVLSHGDDF